LHAVGKHDSLPTVQRARGARQRDPHDRCL
jgi:hypothetical protein